MNTFNTINAICPLDGRYEHNINTLKKYFSEFSLFKYRLLIEIEYFIHLSKKIPQLSNIDKEIHFILKSIYTNFTIDDCNEIKIIEDNIKHDVKAVEYFIQNKFKSYINYPQLKDTINFIHFGLTSQDINCPAQMLMIKNSINDVFYPTFSAIIAILDTIANKYINITMISHTHGQPASPTTFGKEIRVFKYRLSKEIDNLKLTKYSTKFGGAVGNFNAHYVAFPNIDWNKFSDDFISSIGLTRNQYTTQISNYEEISYIFDTFKRINCILIDFNTDIWTYISKNYIKQKINKNEVGSSTMPHKINPINFENSEGNLIIANSLFEGMSRKLPISRLQRDLTDSTILRNTGIAFGYSLVAYKSLLSGLDKIEINKYAINIDIEKNYIVLAEAIQTILRREGINDAYEMLKDFTRKNTNITSKDIYDFIDKLNINNNVKDELRKITVYNYIGNANFYSH